MNKELTPLKALENIKNCIVADDIRPKPMKECCSWEEELNAIEIALKRLEKHDKIFKEYAIDDNWLDLALYVIKNHFPMDTETQLKKLKALDIIKKHIVYDEKTEVLKANFQEWITDKETQDIFKEILK